jgi:hypothetical protein
MLAALAASIGRPRWWVMALAAFLVRGGVIVVLLPLVSLPSAPALATAFAPTIVTLAMSRQSFEAALLGTVLITAAVGILAVLAVTGTWLDNTLAREAEGADELDLRPAQVPPSPWRSLALRLIAHVPTLVALAYAVVRLVIATYQELLSPGDPSVAIALRVVARAPDAIVIAGIAWLVGEALGGVAARRAAEGDSIFRSIRGGIVELLHVRGVATFVLTDIVVAAVLLLLVTVVGRAAEHVRTYLFDRVDDVSLAAALLLLVTTWVLALAVLGAALAWRATAWTVEAAPRRSLASTAIQGDDGVPATTEATAG